MSRFNPAPGPGSSSALNTSVGFDRRLWPQDIAQSRAHVQMLAEREIITAADRDALLAGLEAGRASSWAQTAASASIPTTKTFTWRSSGA